MALPVDRPFDGDLVVDQVLSSKSHTCQTSYTVYRHGWRAGGVEVEVTESHVDLLPKPQLRQQGSWTVQASDVKI